MPLPIFFSLYSLYLFGYIYFFTIRGNEIQMQKTCDSQMSPECSYEYMNYINIYIHVLTKNLVNVFVHNLTVRTILE